MEMCLDDKCKLSKKGSRRSATSSSPVSPKGRTSRGSGRSVPGRLASLAREQRARKLVASTSTTPVAAHPSRLESPIPIPSWPLSSPTPMAVVALIPPKEEGSSVGVRPVVLQAVGHGVGRVWRRRCKGGRPIGYEKHIQSSRLSTHTNAHAIEVATAVFLDSIFKRDHRITHARLAIDAATAPDDTTILRASITSVSDTTPMPRRLGRHSKHCSPQHHHPLSAPKRCPQVDGVARRHRPIRETRSRVSPGAAQAKNADCRDNAFNKHPEASHPYPQRPKQKKKEDSKHIADKASEIEERNREDIMEMCLDDKWKLSKKGSRRLAAVAPTASTTSIPVSPKCRTSRGSGRSVPGRLASLAKEQRARFYIMRRCVTMLVCWRD
ncbi:hypothetical protein QYE76_001485 [Lolium multiflorum]|uniref:Uncharacterized protein n=1 Tax=Lolium multiflorum TaxID=4521 RepID=A0AAD8RKT2_LOLMU|nr:hypothetical protein QYE76_001485 [Lolium multiflorum]